MHRKQSKATQERHDRMLNELYKMLGNDTCADCTAKNPRWASYSLGVFLCIRCASLHRKMGTHISKVKSCSMDCWTLPEIQHMKNLGGNTCVNNQINPNASSNLPIALDDDHVMEKYIRDKWERKRFAIHSDSSSAHSTPAASQEDLVLFPTPSLSSTNSSLVSSPIPQQQDVFAGRHVTAVVEPSPSSYNPFLAAHYEVTQAQVQQHHHKHVISTTPFSSAALTTNPFLQQQVNMQVATNNPFIQHPL
ncbi:Protein gts1 [Mucor circinelloides]